MRFHDSLLALCAHGELASAVNQGPGIDLRPVYGCDRPPAPRPVLRLRVQTQRDAEVVEMERQARLERLSARASKLAPDDDRGWGVVAAEIDLLVRGGGR